MKSKHHYDELTVMSGIAIIFVLTIHGCGSVLKSFYPSGATYADIGLLLRAISNFVAPAVPIFLFVSGFKYAANDVQTPYLIFLKKRLPRVLMSFAVINTVFWALDSIKYMESFDIVLLAKTFLHSWVGYSVAYQLWYIPMYCCVIIVCPLVRGVIPSTMVRFCMYALIGIVQRILEVNFPLLAIYPIRFISYPVFFEMGCVAQEKAWNEKRSTVTGFLGGGIYFFILLLISWRHPELSSNGLCKYVLYYFVGTAVIFMVSCALKRSHILQKLGELSYPVFLMHEPLIGGIIGALLSNLHIGFEYLYVFFWITLDLIVTLLVIQGIKRIYLSKLLWDFKI